MNQQSQADVCRYVFRCSLEDWQVQISPGAQSEFAGANEAYVVLCEAHRDHVVGDHSPAELDTMEADLLAMGLTADSEAMANGSRATYITGYPLPLWWRE